MVTAHMDEVGFVVQAITRSGLIRLAPLGSWWTHVLPAQRVRILTAGGDQIPGVIGVKPPHFLQESERDKVMKLDDMFVDVGAASGDEVTKEFGIRLGDSIVPDTTFRTMHNESYLLGKAFDNRVGMVLTILTLRYLKDVSHPNHVIGAGTVQEEVGTRGAQTAAYVTEPDAAIVLEGTPADDLPGIPEDERQAIVGRGVQIRILDPSAIMNRRFVDHAIAMAERYSIAYQLAVRKTGGTDAKAIHLHARGVPTIVLGVPARYIHTPQSILHVDDCLSALRLILALIHSLDAEAAGRLGDHSD
jgi:putative aminopeptidase FrvX